MRYWLASFYGNTCISFSAFKSEKVFGRIFKIYERNKDLIARFEKISKRRYSYNRWPDGFWIGIEFVPLTLAEYKKAKKNLAGDLGYSWLVENILDHGTPEDLDEKFMHKVIEGDEYYLGAADNG